MTQRLAIHPQSPQPRLVSQAVAVLRGGGLIVYPTDSSYALGCCLEARAAMEAIRRIREVGKDHHFTLVCRDLSEVSAHARIDNSQFRLLKALTPGPYTFILPATREVPRRLQHPRRSTIGLRVPDHAVVQALLDALGEPLMSSTLLLPGEELALNDAAEIAERLRGRVEIVIDAGGCPLEPTTVVDLTESPPRVLRRGRGDVSVFGQ